VRRPAFEIDGRRDKLWFPRYLVSLGTMALPHALAPLSWLNRLRIPLYKRASIICPPEAPDKISAYTFDEDHQEFPLHERALIGIHSSCSKKIQELLPSKEVDVICSSSLVDG